MLVVGESLSFVIIFIYETALFLTVEFIYHNVVMLENLGNGFDSWG